MPDHLPFFSIVIPTTRPHYLKYSLASILKQSYSDFEVIIAFNPPSAKTELVDLPDDKRIKVVRTQTFIPMHENWESGFRNINGQWAMLVGDDDCLIPGALELIAQEIAKRPRAQVLLWQWGGFIAPDWPSAERGHMTLGSFKGAVEVRSSSEIENLMYAFDPDKMSEMKKWLPSIMRGTVSAEIVRQAQEISGYFCHPLTPDYGAAAQIVRLSKEIFLMDFPLVILNHTADSMTAAAHGQREIKETQFYAVAGNPVFRHTIVQNKYHTNRPLICETLMNVRAKYANGVVDHVDLPQFFGWYAAGLSEVSSQGRDVSAALAELEQAVATLAPTDQAATRRNIARYANSSSNVFPPTIRHTVLLWLEGLLVRSARLEGVLAMLVHEYGLDINGPEVGINEISEFTRLAGRLVSRVRSGDHN